MTTTSTARNLSADRPPRFPPLTATPAPNARNPDNSATESRLIIDRWLPSAFHSPRRSHAVFAPPPDWSIVHRETPPAGLSSAPVRSRIRECSHPAGLRLHSCAEDLPPEFS